MKNKIWDILWTLIALYVIITSLLENESTKEIFHIKIDNWIYIAIWCLIGITSMVNLLRKMKR